MSQPPVPFADETPHTEARSRRTSSAGIALLKADPSLADRLAPTELAEATRLVVVPRVDIPAGPWQPRTAADGTSRTSGMLLLDGLIVRETLLAGRRSAQLLGPGDVVDLTVRRADALPTETRWTVSEAATLAVLEGRFALAGRRWPGLVQALQERLMEQVARAGDHRAVSHLPRVELRLLALFWLLSDRWGRASGDGTHLALRLTHEMLGRLVGAQRPTVSLALRELTDTGAMSRHADGGWVLARGSRDLLRHDSAGAPREAAA